jgi:FkbM family methyltransferase
MGFAVRAHLAAMPGRRQVFLDIGANIGFYSLFAALRVGPSGPRVRVAEPTDDVRIAPAGACGATASIGSVHQRGALRSRRGKCRFTVSDGSAPARAGNRRAAQSAPRSIQVRVTRLDDLVRVRGRRPAAHRSHQDRCQGEEPARWPAATGHARESRLSSAWRKSAVPVARPAPRDTYPAVARDRGALGHPAVPMEKGVPWRRSGTLSDIQGRRRALSPFLMLPPKPRRKTGCRDMGRHGDPREPHLPP